MRAPGVSSINENNQRISNQRRNINVHRRNRLMAHGKRLSLARNGVKQQHVSGVA